MRKFLPLVLGGILSLWTFSAFAQTTVCGGDSVSIALSGQTGTVQWQMSTNGTTWTPINGATSPTLVHTPGAETWYRAAVTDGTCDPFYSDTTHVDMGSVTADAGPDKTICQGGSDLLGGSPTASGGVAPYAYLWTPTTGLSATNVANPTVSPTSPNSYYLTVTDSNGCMDMDTVFVDTGAVAQSGFLTFTYTGSNQTFTVPPCGSSITIETWGAEGGNANSNGSDGGQGAYIKGDVAVVPGEILTVIVGQRGDDGVGSLDGGGGGGGSFVIRQNGNVPLVIGAGGGGGCLYPTSSDGTGGSATTSASPAGYAAAAIGQGGNTDNGGGGGTGGGGGGWNSGGLSNNWSGGGGMQGGAGGSSAHVNGQGGFGGGGGSYHGGGGGGGYTGGGGGTYQVGAGGGGSYNSGTNQTNTADTRVGNGQITITW